MADNLLCLDTQHPLRRPLHTLASRPVVTLPREATLRDAARCLSSRRISFAPVLDAEGKALGVITEAQLLRASQQGLSPDTRVDSQLQPAATAPCQLQAEEAYRLCLTRNVSHLLVLDEQGRLDGVVSETDFRCLLNLEVLTGRHRVRSVMQPVAPTLPPQATLAQARQEAAEAPPREMRHEGRGPRPDGRGPREGRREGDRPPFRPDRAAKGAGGPRNRGSNGPKAGGPR